METKVAINELSPSAVSRVRASEAFNSLSRLLCRQDVEIDLSGIDLISISFLDELVLRLLEVKRLASVTFLASSPDVMHKLAKVSAIRNAEVFVRIQAGQPKQIVQPQEESEIVVEPSRRSRRERPAHA